MLLAIPAAAGPGACVTNGAPSFSCPTPPNTDVCGSGGNFYCKIAPNCGANESNNCADTNCGCVCNSGFTRCQTTGQCVATQSCPSGTTFNPCTGGCDTPYVLRSPAVAQSGDINVTGIIRAGSAFELPNGASAGLVLTSDATGRASWQPPGGGGGGITGTGIQNYVARFSNASTLTTGLLFDNGINVGLRTGTPGYALDIRDPGETAIVRVASDNAAKKWTGIRLDRTGLSEKWFLGMNDSDDSFRIRRSGTNDDLVINAGLVSMPAIQVTGGTADGFVLISDNVGVGRWQSPACFGGKFVGFANSIGGIKTSGNQGGYFTGISNNLPTGGMIGFCQSTFPQTHICTTEEVFRTIACSPNLMPTNGTAAWVSSGPPGYTSPASNDCVGWTSSANTDYGTFWKFNPNGGSSFATGCDQAFYVACCQ
ncbi:hypothetical protein EPN90_00315 [Patescibacteria group bacterium]|nr:MAG: hypothetical protein EPN90_00315 [Patescibacteria group bacterium]